MNIKDLIGYQPPKNIDQLIRKSIQLDAPFQHFSTVMIQDKKGLIKGISQSKRNNLILDNFGDLLAEMFTAVSQAQDEISLTDILNAATTVQFYGDNSANDMTFNYNTGFAVGTQIQIGAGVTAATRADYAIETAFGTAPEDDLFNTGDGVYAAGALALSGAIVAGGAGTIGEVLLTIRLLENSGSAVADVALLHDVLAATEAFVLGETITVTYTLNL